MKNLVQLLISPPRNKQRSMLKLQLLKKLKLLKLLHQNKKKKTLKEKKKKMLSRHQRRTPPPTLLQKRRLSRHSKKVMMKMSQSSETSRTRLAIKLRWFKEGQELKNLTPKIAKNPPPMTKSEMKK